MSQNNSNTTLSTKDQSDSDCSLNKASAEKQKDISENEFMNTKRLPTVFEWKGENNVVYITGSFCHWKQKFQMNKISDCLFQITLALPKGIYYFKFIVDGEWKYSKEHSTIEENGIINNVIDTTTIIIEDNSTNNPNKKNVVMKKTIPCPDCYQAFWEMKKTFPPSMLNHFLIKREKDVNVFSSTQRIKQKKIVFIYYKPK